MASTSNIHIRNGWKPLQLGHEGYPKLFVKYVSTDAGYEVKLTDLTNVWEETLSDTQIIDKAEEDGCSISPADGTDQLRILLSKIEAALHNSDGTSVKFESSSRSDAIVLNVSAPLPEPLEPFLWRLHLVRADAAGVTAAIVAPLLDLAHEQQNKIRELEAQIHQKDHVISKLLDRMESANVHLDSVFLLPNVRVSKKSSQREQYAKHVPGLAPSQQGRSSPSNELFEVLKSVPVDGLGSDPINLEDDWWHTAPKTRHNHDPPKRELSMDLDGQDTEDEDFQIQQVSEQPRVAKSTNTASVRATTEAQTWQADSDAETTDDGEPPSSPPRPLEELRFSSPPTMTSTSMQPPSQRLGALGGGRARRGSTAAKRDDDVKSTTPAPEAGKAKAISRPAASATPPPESESTFLKSSPTKRRLGALGGRGASQNASQLSQQSSPSKIADKSGGIGLSGTVTLDDRTEPLFSGSNKEQPHQGYEDGVKDHESSAETTSRARETSVERANKKRDELKRQLDSKANAAVKKKRRF